MYFVYVYAGGLLAELEAEGEGDLARGWPREPPPAPPYTYIVYHIYGICVYTLYICSMSYILYMCINYTHI